MTNGQFTICPEIKKMVTFAQANLVNSAPIPLSGLMDVIFCRNVLSYFTPEHVKRVLERFCDRLVDGGWLIVGPEESTYLTASPFVPVVEQGITVYRKERLPSRAPLVFPAAQTDTASPHSLPPRVLLSLTTPAPHPGLRLVPSSHVVGNSPLTPALQLQSATASTTAAALSSSQPEMPYDQAYALYEQGQYEQAVNLLLLRCSAGRDPHSPIIISTQEFSLLARTYANQGQLTEAQHWCKQALHNAQSNPSLHYLLAIIFLEQERIPDAVYAFREALSADPDFALAHFALGNLLQRQHRHEEARLHLSNALAILQGTSPEGVLPETTGLTASRLPELEDVMRQGEPSK
jgi:chemotaxis protein methyltransferase CheR